jgi:hypothetical protein
MGRVSRLLFNTEKFIKQGGHAEKGGYMSNKIGEYFDYLTNLKKAGIINMCGATPCLMHKFGLTEEESMDVLTRWMMHYMTGEVI